MSKFSQLSKNSLNNSFTVMTFNTEILLRLFDYIYKYPEEVKKFEHDREIESATLNQERYSKFKNIFNDVDIFCEQEGYIATNCNNINNIGKLNLRATGRSHVLTWKKSVFNYGVGCCLANKIYTTDDFTVNSIIEKEISNEFVLPYNRNAIMTELSRNKNIVSVLASHLSGGRLIEERLFTDPNFYKYSEEEFNEIIKLKPDIVCIDSNKKYMSSENIIKKTNSYRDSIINDLIAKNKIINESTEIRNKKWADYIWLDDPNNENNIFNKFINEGYLPAYTGKDFSDSTRYGGVIDIIFYNPKKVTLVKDSVQIVNKDEVMKYSSNGRDEYDPILSDHFPIKATFTFNDE
jgi:hypothetical protein